MSRVGRLSLLLTVSLSLVPFRAVLCRGEPGRVAREIVVVSVGGIVDTRGRARLLDVCLVFFLFA